MACTLTRGRLKACKENVGGIKRIWVCDWELPTLQAYDADEQLTEMTATLFQYNLPNGTASFSQPIQADRAAGTVYYEPTLEINLFGLTKEDRKELTILSRMNLLIFAEDFNSNIFQLGRDGGMDVSGGDVQSGQNIGDQSGYTLTFTGEEKDQAQFVTPYTATPFDTAGFSGTPGTVTITVGT